MSRGKDDGPPSSAAEQLEALVDALVAQLEHVPGKARPLFQRWELPVKLQPLANPPTDRETWRAWALGDRVWFVAARRLMHGNEPRPQHARALQMFFHDIEGRFLSSALWLRGESGRWQLSDASGTTSINRKLDTQVLQKLRSTGGM